jgi:hypothetical protein
VALDVNMHVEQLEKTPATGLCYDPTCSHPLYVTKPDACGFVSVPMLFRKEGKAWHLPAALLNNARESLRAW